MSSSYSSRSSLAHCGLSVRVSNEVGRAEVQQAPELVVAGDAPLPVAQDVHRRQVQVPAVRHLEVLQEAGVVVQGDGPRVGGAEGVQHVQHGDPLVDHVLGVPEGRLGEGHGLQVGPGGQGAEVELVRDQGVQAVDRGELLGQGVGGAVVVGDGAGDAADDVAPAQAPEEAVEALLGQAPPVGPHPQAQGGVGQDPRRPLHGVDLGHQGPVDQARRLEQLVVRPGRALAAQAVADGVVLQGEEGVQEPQADPPVVVKPGDGDPRLGVDGQAPVLDDQLPVFHRPQALR